MSEADDTRRLLEDRAARYRAPLTPDSEAVETTEMVVFTRGAARYGLPVGDLLAIHRVDAITPLPGLSPRVKGLANLGGRVFAVHDLGAFAKEPRPLGDELWLLACRGVGDGVALLADDVDGVRPIPPSSLRPPPLSLDAIQDCFLGIGEDGVAYLDLPRLLLNEAFFKA